MYSHWSQTLACLYSALMKHCQSTCYIVGSIQPTTWSSRVSYLAHARTHAHVRATYTSNVPNSFTLFHVVLHVFSLVLFQRNATPLFYNTYSI